MYPHSAKIWWAGGGGQKNKKNKYKKTDPKQGLNQGLLSPNLTFPHKL